MNHMKYKKFSSEVELGSFLGSSHIISYAYDAILKTGSAHYRHYTNLSGCNVLVFGFSADGTARFLHGEANDSVSSKDHKVVDFIATKGNPSFSINRTAVGLFESLFGEISKLKDQLMFEPLVITGQALGGYVATLFALWLQYVVDEKASAGSKNTKRPICITFGLPLVGDDAFQQAISERPQWKSCFLNVVSNTDPIPRLLLSPDHAYKPYGTYLFCTESGGYGCFEDRDSILRVLDAMVSSSVGNLNDYGDALRALKKKVLYRGVSQFDEFNFNPLREGITLQLIQVGVLNPQDNNSTNVLVTEMEGKQSTLIVKRRKTNPYDPAKKLNDIKISLIAMELCMKTGRSKGNGYYDAFKNQLQDKTNIESLQEIIKHKRILNQYWSKFVEEKDLMPQKEGSKLRTRWLLSGMNYRRIVEPLDIAEHYKDGKKSNYIAQRASHYKKLEKWLDEDKKDKDPNEKRTKAASLTEDSCFWARVEEALICLREMDVADNVNELNDELVKFEGYVMKSINEYTVSPEIFLEGSSFMKWWREYRAYRGNVYASPLAQYMNSESYHSYE